MREPAAVVLVLGLILIGTPAAGPRTAAAAGLVIPLPADDRLALAMLGTGVIGDAVPAEAIEPGRFLHTRPGRWTYRIVAGAHQGQTEIERFEPARRDAPRTDWTRNVGGEYVLDIRSVSDGSLVLPREVIRSQGVVVHFEPPLTYLIAGLRPGERRTAESRMSVFSAENPRLRRYSGRIISTTAYVGAYRVRTPAGAFDAALIRTDYAIEVFGVVSVQDVLYTLYAAGVGKIAEAERRRVSAMWLPMSGLETAKVLVDRWTEPDVVEVSAPSTPPPISVEQQAP